MRAEFLALVPMSWPMFYQNVNWQSLLLCRMQTNLTRPLLNRKFSKHLIRKNGKFEKIPLGRKIEIGRSRSLFDYKKLKMNMISIPHFIVN